MDSVPIEVVTPPSEKSPNTGEGSSGSSRETYLNDRQQHRMVDAVEALRYVSLDEPLDPSPVFGDFSEGGVTTSMGTESMGVRAELRLVVGVQKRAHHFLQQFIRPCGYPERTQFP